MLKKIIILNEKKRLIIQTEVPELLNRSLWTLSSLIRLDKVELLLKSGSDSNLKQQTTLNCYNDEIQDLFLKYLKLFTFFYLKFNIFIF